MKKRKNLLWMTVSLAVALPAVTFNQASATAGSEKGPLLKQAATHPNAGRILLAGGDGGAAMAAAAATAMAAPVMARAPRMAEPVMARPPGVPLGKWSEKGRAAFQAAGDPVLGRLEITGPLCGGAVRSWPTAEASEPKISAPYETK